MMERVRTIVDNVAEALDGPSPTRRDRLVESWARIQEYYTPQRSDDLRQITVADTTIPHHLECMLRIIANEMVEDGGAADPAQPLEFGPCVEYLLQYHVLSDLVDLADRDTPRGVHMYVVRFFDLFIGCIPLGLLPESAIRLPLVAIMRQCLHIVQTSPAAPMAAPGRTARDVAATAAALGECRLGRGYHSVHRDRPAVIACHDLLHLIVTLFQRLREHSSMVDLFFDWGSGWPAAGGGSGGELAVSSLRSATSEYAEQSARGHELFIVHMVVEYLLAPGLAGQLAREALVLVVQVLVAPADSGRYVSFLLDHARIVEVLVEHMGYLYSQMPMYRPVPRSPAAAVFGSAYRGPRCMGPLERRMARGGSPPPPPPDVRDRLRALLGTPTLLRARAEQEQREDAIVGAAREALVHVDAFFVCWELLDEVACVAEGAERVVAAVQSQLVNAFLRTHIEPALLSATAPATPLAAKSQVITTVSYLSDLLGATHSDRVLDALFMVLLGSDLSPERAPVAAGGSDRDGSPRDGGADAAAVWSLLSEEDRELLDSIDDEAMRAEAAQLLLPPGADVTQLLPAPGARATDAAPTVRAAMISWMEVDDGTHLALNALRLFDAILGTMNQFAYASLVLRNFADGADVGHQPALGLGASPAVDQELVRAVVERFLDATPGSISAAMPDVVVSAAIRIDQAESGSGSITDAAGQRLEAPQRNLQTMRSHIMRESKECDVYVDDCLQRLRAAQACIQRHWRPQHELLPAAPDSGGGVSDALFYPGAFLASLVRQMTTLVKRHIAFGLTLTSLVNRLTCVGDPALSSYLFMANSATLAGSGSSSSSEHQPLFLYDAFVWASADAYVKSERVPKFPARLAKQLREGIETAVRVGAVHPIPDYEHPPSPAPASPQRRAAASPRVALAVSPAPAAFDHAMDVEMEPAAAERGMSQKEVVAATAAFLGTPIKRFVHGYILLDEFGKEMAAMAMALHMLELDRQLAAMRIDAPLPPSAAAAADDYAELLEYFDPAEPAYRQAALVRDSLAAAPRPVIDLGSHANKPLPRAP
ncbi:hypothetical protein IWQ56_000309 [Coemansia nantahalensis]|nr:hypothetical protein IWQ56_000309 [Coemansia nantahalensis]